jgi:hypothetical protein
MSFRVPVDNERIVQEDIKASEVEIPAVRTVYADNANDILNQSGNPDDAENKADLADVPPVNDVHDRAETALSGLPTLFNSSLTFRNDQSSFYACFPGHGPLVMVKDGYHTENLWYDSINFIDSSIRIMMEYLHLMNLPRSNKRYVDPLLRTRVIHDSNILTSSDFLRDFLDYNSVSRRSLLDIADSSYKLDSRFDIGSNLEVQYIPDFLYRLEHLWTLHRARSVKDWNEINKLLNHLGRHMSDLYTSYLRVPLPRSESDYTLCLGGNVRFLTTLRHLSENLLLPLYHKINQMGVDLIFDNVQYSYATSESRFRLLGNNLDVNFTTQGPIHELPSKLAKVDVGLFFKKIIQCLLNRVALVWPFSGQSEPTHTDLVGLCILSVLVPGEVLSDETYANLTLLKAWCLRHNINVDFEHQLSLEPINFDNITIALGSTHRCYPALQNMNGEVNLYSALFGRQIRYNRIVVDINGRDAVRELEGDAANEYMGLVANYFEGLADIFSLRRRRVSTMIKKFRGVANIFRLCAQMVPTYLANLEYCNRVASAFSWNAYLNPGSDNRYRDADAATIFDRYRVYADVSYFHLANNLLIRGRGQDQQLDVGAVNDEDIIDIADEVRNGQDDNAFAPLAKAYIPLHIDGVELVASLIGCIHPPEDVLQPPSGWMDHGVQSGSEITSTALHYKLRRMMQTYSGILIERKSESMRNALKNSPSSLLSETFNDFPQRTILVLENATDLFAEDNLANLGVQNQNQALDKDDKNDEEVAPPPANDIRGNFLYTELGLKLHVLQSGILMNLPQVLCFVSRGSYVSMLMKEQEIYLSREFDDTSRPNMQNVTSTLNNTDITSQRVINKHDGDMLYVHGVFINKFYKRTVVDMDARVTALTNIDVATLNEIPYNQLFVRSRNDVYFARVMYSMNPDQQNDEKKNEVIVPIYFEPDVTALLMAGLYQYFDGDLHQYLVPVSSTVTTIDKLRNILSAPECMDRTIDANGILRVNFKNCECRRFISHEVTSPNDLELLKLVRRETHPAYPINVKEIYYPTVLKPKTGIVPRSEIPQIRLSDALKPYNRY